MALAVACSPADSPRAPTLTRLTPGAGFPEGGDRVTLVGSGLDTVTAVTLVPSDGSGCPTGCALTGLVRKSATTLQAIIPAQPVSTVTLYDLRVTTSAGPTATLPGAWTYDHPRGRFQPFGLRMPMESGSGKSGRIIDGLFTPAWMGVVGNFTRQSTGTADVFLGGNGGRSPRLLQGDFDPAGGASSAVRFFRDQSGNLFNSDGTPVEDGPFAAHRYDVFKPIVFDLDNNGWPDVAFWNDATHAFTVFWNTNGLLTAREYPGPPGFDPTDLVGPGSSPGRSLDFNLDGFPDFLAVGGGTPPFVILGCGAPASAWCFLGGSAPQITVDLQAGSTTLTAAQVSGFTSTRLTDFMAVGRRWIVDVGPSTEIVTLSGVTATSFTATFARPHAAGAVLAPIIETTAHAPGPIAANTSATVTLDDVSGFALADLWLVADPGQPGEERIHLTAPAVDFAARTVTLSFSRAHPKDFALGVRDPKGFVLDDTRFNATAGTYAAVAGDVDGDGDVDVILGNQGTGIQVFESSASQLIGNGQDPIAFALSASPAVMAKFLPGDVTVGDVRALALVDANSDGLLDLVAAASGGQERLFYNHGGISGQPILREGDPGSAPCADGQPNRVPVSTGNSVVRYDVRDLDGDGMPDLLAFLDVCSPPDGRERPLRVWLNDGKGCFVDGMGGQADAGVTERFFPSSLGVTSGWDYALGDIDGDGLPDMILGADGAQTREYVNVAGAFRDKTATNLASAVSANDSVRWWKHSTGALLVDLNGDGFSDLLVSQFDAEPNVSGGTSACTGAQRVCAIGEGGVHAYLNDGQGNFSHDDTATVLPGPLPIASWSMDSAILYPGGPLGIVIASATEYQGGVPASLAGTPFAGSYGATRLLTQAAGGSLADSTATWLPPDKTLRFASSAKLVDLDGDGRMDLVLGDAASGQIQVWQGTPTGFVDVTATALPGGALASPCSTNRVNQIVPGTLRGTPGKLPDLFLARDCQSRLLVNATVRGSGTIVLNDETATRLPSPAPAALSAVAGDLDCHGGNDLFLVTSTGETLLAGGDCGSQATCGVFTDISADVLPPPSLGSSCIGADCTGDARVIPLPMGGPGTDLFVARASSAFTARPHRILRNHCGRFAELTSYPSKPLPWDDDRIGGVVAGDVFGHAGRDTGTDLVLVGDGVVRVYEGREFGPPTCSISGVTVAANPSSMRTGESSALHATLASSGTCSGGVTWSVSPSGGTLNPNGLNATFSATTPGAYTIRAVSADAPSESGSVTVTVLGPAPVLGSVTPAVGPLAGGSSVTLQGTGFGASPVVTFGGAAARVVGTPTATVIQVITPPHDAGPVNVTVTNADGQLSTLAGGFTYRVTNQPPPAIGAVLPGRGAPAGGGLVLITGTGFSAPAVVTFGGVPASVVGTPTATVIQVSTPPHELGPVDVTVTNADGQSSILTGGFVYQATSLPPPVIATVVPNSGQPAGGGLVVITGTGFSAPALVTFGGVPATVAGTPSATAIQVSAPPHAAGTVDVTVTNADGQSSTLAGGFTYQVTNQQPPAIASVIPAVGSPTGGGVITITGTGFNAPVVTFGGAAARVVGTPTATVIQVMTPPHATGAVDVTVTNADGQSSILAGGFTYQVTNQAPPAIGTVLPGRGSPAGGGLVLITGTGFAPAVVTFGGVPASVVGTPTASVIQVSTPPNAPGTVDVTVTNADGQSSTLAGGFTYQATDLPPPVIATVVPNSGQPAGGGLVVITGTGFSAPAVVTFGGVPATVAGTPSATAIQVSAPPHAAGTVDVTVTNADGQSSVVAGAYTYLAAGFQVSTVTPTGGSSGNQASATTVQALLSAAIDCARATAASLQVFEGATPVPGTAVCSGSSLTFQPTDALPTFTTLRGHVDGAVGDLAGNSLGSAYDWSFGMAPWSRQVGSAAYDEARGVATGPAGDVFVAGYTQGALDGNTLTGMNDLFAVRYDRSGARQWTRQLGAAGASTHGLAAAADGSGNLYVAGETNGDLDGNTSAGAYDLFLVKYDLGGTKQWTREIGTPGAESTGGVAVDGTGAVYVAGWTNGNFDGHVSAGAEDMVLVKYDSTGVKVWSQQHGSPAQDEAMAVAVDTSGNILVAGFTTGRLDGNIFQGQTDAFVAKFSSSGTWLWSRAIGSSQRDQANGVAADGAGNIYLVGWTYGGMGGNLNLGGQDGFLAKYDPDGGLLWIRQVGTASSDFALAVAVDSAGNPYVTGGTQGSMDGVSNLSSTGTNLFVARYDPNGNLVWAHQRASSTYGYDETQAIALDGRGNVFAAGFTNGGMDGNTSAGDYDACVVKYELAGKPR